VSCRSTKGGQAASSCATALTGGSADRASYLMHALLAIYQTNAPDPNSAEVVDVFQALATKVRNDPQISERRKERVLRRVEAAIDQASSGEGLPNAATLYAWRNLPAALEADMLMSGRTATSSGVTDNVRRERPELPYHKRFKNFNPKTVEATKELFRARPSQLVLEDVEVVFKKWIADISKVYDIPTPDFVWEYDDLSDIGGGLCHGLREDENDENSPFYNSVLHIDANRRSITTLIHEYRHHMQFMGMNMVDEDVEEDARAWSLSLYYKTRPVLFERLVREGKIFHIDPRDL